MPRPLFALCQRVLAAGLLAAVAAGCGTSPAVAQGAAGPTPQEQAMQGLDLILKGLRGMIEQVPIYGPPEMLPNGDILIRRVSPPPDAPTGTTPGTKPAPAPGSLQRM